MRDYIISGEASGDLHGSNLIAAMRRKDPQADIRCWGGDKMQAAGATLVKHYRDLAFMGFVEVLVHLRTIVNNLDFCKKDISQFKPDVLVLIDYPGFNLRIAEWAKQQSILVVYYISPQVWAWKENRVKKIKRDVDEMIVILPFEVEFYRKWKYPVTYVGHPLTEVVQNDRELHPVEKIGDKKLIALLPGSRAQEIRVKLPVMLEMVNRFPEYQFVVAQAPSQPDSLYRELAAGLPVVMVRDQTYNLLKQSVAALVTSGTATLETGLFGVPQIVCYKGNPVSFWLAKKLVKVKYISLVNLIMDKMVVTELIQNDLTADRLYVELNNILSDPARKEQMHADYSALWHLLGDMKASDGAADIVVMTAARNKRPNAK